MKTAAELGIPAMSPDDIVREFRKGCSNTVGRKPEDCDHCLGVALALLLAHDFTGHEALSLLKATPIDKLN